ncbi:unnamed protein product (macronuclear) [Paramecium tetraurelia]|uniref:Uncharacterized protein n=1 Tax=Paramecium tetraurelia TaxID=5888 RepID=A0ECL9_PARTE|nr:uncharacterized protein GSPATT00003905001 [Paramecium tetraurelia]CAK93036.1 unnamed protein product [Paramecium tetraurelia]|eukprot:XP_001460433.1 hypothetical protein (macronuclear) [Paramecium tetraurelia strain d4-2]
MINKVRVKGGQQVMDMETYSPIIAIPIYLEDMKPSEVKQQYLSNFYYLLIFYSKLLLNLQKLVIGMAEILLMYQQMKQDGQKIKVNFFIMATHYVMIITKIIVMMNIKLSHQIRIIPKNLQQLQQLQIWIYIIMQIVTILKKYWGLRDFTLAIVRCPSGCLYCSDNDYNNCYYWIGFLSLWQESIELEGWMKNDNIQPATYKCVRFELVGGYLNLASNDKLYKIFQNLSPHYKIQINFQLWIIDTRQFQGEYFQFQLFIDDQIYNQTVFSDIDFYSICGGSNGLENIYNIVVSLPHTSQSCKLTMRTSPNAATNAYWGIRAFNIYLAKCCKGCDECFGPLKTECTVCSSEWVLYKNLCTNSPPMLLSQISTSQIKDLQSDDRIPIEINLLEVDQQINTQGNFTISVKNQYKFLTVQVYIKCLPKTRIKSLFQSNKLQDSYQYSFFLNCQQAFNTVIYNVKYEQRIIREQEMIINTSDTQCVIYQVIRVIDELPLFVKILEIIIEDF